MHEPEPKNWHQKTWVRILLLIFAVLIAGGLYLISIRIATQRPRTVPATPDTSGLE
ncbi:hypothetical protein [Coleofasciculus sp.]|uniref:hypothetical protein n=1 Tax=Coleofasciculus sp. TaxID=3100458 RepID=UPI003A43C314